MCMSLMVAQLAMAAAGAAMAQQQAKRAAQAAAENAKSQYAAAKANTEAKYAETNRKIAESQIDALDEKSDKIREANYQMGTFRAAETALSDSSLGTIAFEQMYGDSLDAVRMDRNQQRMFWALESEKTGAEVNYINQTTMAENQARNQIQEANARASEAFMGAIGSGLSIGANYKYQQDSLQRIKTS